MVKLSVLGADEEDPVRFGRVHAESERYLEGSGLAYTILRPTGFMQNTLAFAPSVASEGRFYAPLAEAKVAPTTPATPRRSPPGPSPRRGTRARYTT